MRTDTISVVNYVVAVGDDDDDGGGSGGSGGVDASTIRLHLCIRRNSVGR